NWWLTRRTSRSRDRASRHEQPAVAEIQPEETTPSCVAGCQATRPAVASEISECIGGWGGIALQIRQHRAGRGLSSVPGLAQTSSTRAYRHSVQDRCV